MTRDVSRSGRVTEKKSAKFKRNPTTGYDDGGESTEPEQPDKTLFFNTAANSAMGEEFPVNAISAEELKARYHHFQVLK